jgi:hypothetical protein
MLNSLSNAPTIVQLQYVNSRLESVGWGEKLETHGPIHRLIRLQCHHSGIEISPNRAERSWKRFIPRHGRIVAERNSGESPACDACRVR